MYVMWLGNDFIELRVCMTHVSCLICTTLHDTFTYTINYYIHLHTHTQGINEDI